MKYTVYVPVNNERERAIGFYNYYKALNDEYIKTKGRGNRIYEAGMRKNKWAIDGYEKNDNIVSYQ